jgi:two-component system NarL family sensor kinase
METEKLITISVLASTVFITGLILVIIGLINGFNKNRVQQRQKFEMQLKNKELELMNAVVIAQEQERAKIARGLHDEVGSLLSMVQRNLSATAQDVPKETLLAEDIQFAIEILDQSVEKLRSISQGMLPHFLIKFGLQKALLRLMEQTQKTLGYPCNFTTTFEDRIFLEEQQEIHFYTIIIELVNNLRKHAHPQFIHLHLYSKGQFLFVDIEHDGIALSQADYDYLLLHGEGMGLESITHRLNLIQGEILFQRLNVGGKVELAMPFIKKTIEK